MDEHRDVHWGMKPNKHSDNQKDVSYDFQYVKASLL